MLNCRQLLTGETFFYRAYPVLSGSAEGRRRDTSGFVSIVEGVFQIYRQSSAC